MPIAMRNHSDDQLIGANQLIPNGGTVKLATAASPCVIRNSRNARDDADEQVVALRPNPDHVP